MDALVLNLLAVKEAIAKEALSADRNPAEIQLVAVSKTKPIADIRTLFDAGQIDFGENRVQELLVKQPAIPGARWHMIGTLQRNKVKQIAGFVHLIHSIDSDRLLEEVDRQALGHGRIIDCLLQINISHETQKSGMEEPEAAKILQEIRVFPNVRILGLMGMAEFTDDTEVVRRQFRLLREIRDRLSTYNDGTHIDLKNLSMGMSGDYGIAIQEGSTLVRIGSSIFGGR